MPAPGEVGAIPTLAGTHPVVGSPVAEKRALAVAQSYNYVTGGICGALVIMLPHPADWSEAALVPFALVAVAIGAILYRYGDRLPIRLLATTPALATLMTSAVVILTGTAISPFTVFYLWIGLYAFYFLARPVAIAQIAFAALNFAAIFLLLGVPAEIRFDGADALSYLVVAVATVVMAGILLGYLRRRLGILVGSLAEASQSDPLTGLPNLRSFRSTVDAEIERATTGCYPVSVLIGDIDRLRGLNESLGHDGADQILRGIGQAIRETRRPIDSVARTGSGTFAVVLPDTSHHEALLAAEELLGTVRRGYRPAGGPVVTMSFGTATYPADAGSPASLIHAADRALDAAKVLGRDRAVVASPELDEILGGDHRPNVNDSLSHLKTLLSLAEALDQRDAGTSSHAHSVGAFSEQLARELGIPEPRVARVRLAGILHDIGKVGVPDEILFNENPLDESAWAKLRRHPEIGARILGTSELADIREWVLSSQERLDGRGYPRGLREADIPLEARIIRVADAWDAMTSDRLYRPALGEREAREELKLGVGKQFDPEVVEALFSLLEREAATAESMQ